MGRCEGESGRLGFEYLVYFTSVGNLLERLDDDGVCLCCATTGKELLQFVWSGMMEVVMDLGQFHWRKIDASPLPRIEAVTVPVAWRIMPTVAFAYQRHINIVGL